MARRVELVDPMEERKQRRIQNFGIEKDKLGKERDKIEEAHLHSAERCQPGCEGCGPVVRYRLIKLKKFGWIFDRWIETQAQQLERQNNQS